MMPARKRTNSKATKSRPKKVLASKRAAQPDDSAVREHVLYLLKGGGAHVGFEKAIDDLPENRRGAKVEGLPFSPWRLLEHLRIAQWDILEFSRDARHVSPSWPDGYWPETDAPPSEEAWDNSVARFRSDLKSMERLVSNPKTDLYAKIPHGDGQTILREALLVADHNAYHLGQLVILRRLLGSWHD
jgi:hypothetical protein